MNGHDKRQEEKRLQKLARYIKNHGHRTMISQGKLFAELTYTVKDDPNPKFKWEEIDANPEAVRLWLGY